MFMLLYDSSGTIILPNVSRIIHSACASESKSVSNKKKTAYPEERKNETKTVNIMRRAPLWTLGHSAPPEMVGTTPAY